MEIAALIAIVLQHLKYRSGFDSYTSHLLRMVGAAKAENTGNPEQHQLLIALEKDLSAPLSSRVAFPGSSAGQRQCIVDSPALVSPLCERKTPPLA
jgi:hypothetical protein